MFSYEAMSAKDPQLMILCAYCTSSLLFALVLEYAYITTRIVLECILCIPRWWCSFMYCY